MQHTPGGWPYMSSGDYVDTTPEYSNELANKLEGAIGTAPGTIVDTGWVSVSPASGFTGDLEYRVMNGICHLRGTLTRTAGAFTGSYVTAATLPSAARPGATIRYALSGDNPSLGICEANLTSFGTLSLRAIVSGPGRAWVSMTYPVG